MGFMNSDKINQALLTKANVSNTYTKNEVNTKIAALPQYTRTVVDELPESGDTNTLYLLKVEHTEEYDYCDEYIWLTEKVGESNWEKTGTNIKTINGESLLGSGDMKVGTLTARLMTQAEYDALQNKDNNTLYIITDAL